MPSFSVGQEELQSNSFEIACWGNFFC